MQLSKFSSSWLLRLSSQQRKYNTGPLSPCQGQLRGFQ